MLVEKLQKGPSLEEPGHMRQLGLDLWQEMGMRV
jgi:hypothetical protein